MDARATRLNSFRTLSDLHHPCLLAGAGSLNVRAHHPCRHVDPVAAVYVQQGW